MQYSTLIRKKDKGYQYIITYKVGDKWKTKSKQGFKKKQDAQTAMDKALIELKKVVKNRIDPSMTGITFKQFSEMYLEHLSLYRTTNTILSLKTVLNHFKEFNDKEMGKISNVDIQRVIDGLTRKELSPNTIRDYLLKLNTIFKSAMEEYNIITSLPTKNLKINKDKKSTNKRALNKKELENLLDDFKNSKYYLLLLIASTCGLRLGEVLGLTWDNIDEINCILTVDKQWKQVSPTEYNFGTLKSKNSNRQIPIPSKTLNVLKNSKKVVNIDNRILNFKNTDSVSICINRLLKRKGYDITIHELRHTYATNLISNGIDFKTAAKLLGHTVEQTMRTYSHVTDDMLSRATSIIENIF
ncbi:MAG: site-specific integrase [Clostridium lundense]|nr:site-specific integrase [Clostridium lundense]